MKDPLAILATIASTLEEVKEAPESSLWLPFMNDISLSQFHAILGVLIKMNVCTVSNHLVTYTEPTEGTDGARFMAEVRRIYAEAKT